MSLISRLGRRFREKPKSTNLDLPNMPTPREILEDIESCSSKDPIISFANLIQKKGPQSLLDSIFLEASSSSTQNTKLDFLLPYQTALNENSKFEDAQLQIKHNAVPKRKGSIPSSLSSGSVATGSYKKRTADDVEQLNNYNKLKQFLLLYEKSEELLENIEPHFKIIETTLQSCEAYSNDVNACKDGESDFCSSPLT